MEEVNFAVNSVQKDCWLASLEQVWEQHDLKLLQLKYSAQRGLARVLRYFFVQEAWLVELLMIIHFIQTWRQGPSPQTVCYPPFVVFFFSKDSFLF